MKSKTKKIVKGLFFSIFAFFALMLLLFPANLKACEECLTEEDTQLYNVSEQINETNFEECEMEPLGSSLNMDDYYGIEGGLKTKPILDIYDLLEKVKIGDIYFERKTKIPLVGHVAVVTGIKYDSHYKRYYIELTENAQGHNVCRGMLDDKRFLAREGSLFRMKNISSSGVDAVLNSLSGDLGKPYDFFTFNCAGLVYKAFKAAGYTLLSDFDPSTLISDDRLQKCQVGEHSCTTLNHYSSYSIIDEHYHRTTCYCGKIYEHFHVTSNSSYCIFCNYNFGNGGGPSIEFPFSRKSKLTIFDIYIKKIFARNVVEAEDKYEYI